MRHDIYPVARVPSPRYVESYLLDPTIKTRTLNKSFLFEKNSCASSPILGGLIIFQTTTYAYLTHTTRFFILRPRSTIINTPHLPRKRPHLSESLKSCCCCGDRFDSFLFSVFVSLSIFCTQNRLLRRLRKRQLSKDDSSCRLTVFFSTSASQSPEVDVWCSSPSSSSLREIVLGVGTLKTASSLRFDPKISIAIRIIAVQSWRGKKGRQRRRTRNRQA